MQLRTDDSPLGAPVDEGSSGGDGQMGEESPAGGGTGQKRGFTAFTSVCFTVNYLVGTGFLTIPWAFDRGGILLSTVTMIVVATICNTTKNYVLTAMARAEALLSKDDKEENEVGDEEKEGLIVSAKDRSRSESPTSEYGSVKDKAEEDTAEESNVFSPLNVSMLGPSSSKSNAVSSSSSCESARCKPLNNSEGFGDEINATATSLAFDELLIVKDRKFEYAELCRIFLGPRGERAYLGCVTVAIFLQLWGYAAVFALGMAQAHPIRNGSSYDDNYKLYTVLFGIVVVPLSCLELREQVGFQIVLSLCRFLVIFIMICTSWTALRNNDPSKLYFTDIEESVSSSREAIINFSGFYEMFSVLVYTAMFHNGIPVLSEPVHDRTRLSLNFRDAIVLVCFACWVLGIVSASYFGHQVEQSANLNWYAYVGGTGHPGVNGVGWVDVSFRSRAIAAFVVLFPVLNVMSAYPLNAIVLGNNLLIAARTGAVGRLEGGTTLPSRLSKIVFRLLASVPPLLGAYFVKELGIITSYAGVLAVITVLSFPSLLYIQSVVLMKTYFGSVHKTTTKRTYYDGLGSSVSGARAVLVTSVLATFYILLKLIMGSSSSHRLL